MDDDDLGTLIHRAVATLEPPTQRLADGGLQRGRRERRRRRIAGAGTGAVLVSGVVAVAAAALAGGTGGGGKGTPAAGSGGARIVAVTPQAVLQTALDTLPRPGDTAGYAGASMDGYAGANFVFDDGHGAAALQVAVGYPPAAAGPKDAGSISPCSIKTSGCTLLPDGGHLQVRQGHQYDDGRTPNAAEWAAQLVRPDGVSITITEWNASEPKDAAPTRTDPPFTVVQLATWVQDRAWRASIPAARAAATAGLFTPADLQAKVATVGRLSAADCEKAARAHKVPAGSCKLGGH